MDFIVIDNVRIKNNSNIIRSYEKMMVIVSEYGGKFLSDEYTGVKRTYDYQCEHGHKFSTTANAINSIVSWCRICAIFKWLNSRDYRTEYQKRKALKKYAIKHNKEVIYLEGHIKAYISNK